MWCKIRNKVKSGELGAIHASCSTLYGMIQLFMVLVQKLLGELASM